MDYYEYWFTDDWGKDELLDYLVNNPLAKQKGITKENYKEFLDDDTIYLGGFDAWEFRF